MICACRCCLSSPGCGANSIANQTVRQRPRPGETSMKHPSARPDSMRAALACTVAAVLVAAASLAAAQTPAPKGSADHIRQVTQAVDGDAIVANTATTQDWPSHGLDYQETRFSKLDQVNAGNVKDLGLMWSYNLESIRGVEA